MAMRTILITGATGKLGRQMVSHFLAAGDRIVATGRTEDSIGELRRAHAGAGDRLLAVAVDFMDPAAIGSLLVRLEAVDWRPDGLVNNARSLAYLGTRDDGTTTREDFVGEFVVDVVAPYELTMAIALRPDSALRNVVNIGSQYGVVAGNSALYQGHRRYLPIQYSVAKAGLAHLTRELAVRLAGKGVRVNCVAFGGFEGRTDEGFRARYASLCPMGRMLRDDEVVGPVEFLLSDASSSMTGETISADGGWTLW